MLIAISLVLGIAAYLLRHTPLWSIGLGILSAAVAAFALWFFRDPERTIPPHALNERYVLAPADGRVISISETTDGDYLKGKACQISIFLSPLDVHVNRYPVSGVVEFVRYYPGDYLVAWHPKSSELNERSTIGVRTAHGKVLFRQVTGVLARRIVFDTKEGDTIHAGDRFGMMKFGSRMDVLVPLASRITVHQGDRVRAAETVIAELP